MSNDNNFLSTCKKYLQERGIQNSVIEQLEQKNLVSYEENKICFKMRDLDGTITGTQERYVIPIIIGDKSLKSKTQAGSKVSYFYLSLDFAKPVIITEGEIDTFSLNLDNVIGLQGINNLKRLVEELKFNGAKVIYLLTDKDQASNNAIGSLFSHEKGFLSGIYDCRSLLNAKDVNAHILIDGEIKYVDIENHAKPLEGYLELINSLVIRSSRGATSLNFDKISVHFMDKYNIKSVDGNIFQYQFGIWRLLNPLLVQKMIIDELNLLFNLLIEQVKTSDKNSVYDMLLSNAYDEELKNHLYLQENSFINLKEGIYDPIEKTLIQYKKEFYKIQKFDYSYSIFATYKEPEKRLYFLNQILEGYKDKEKIVLFLQEFVGYCLTSSTKLEKALLLFGSGGNGKGVFLSIMKEILGRDNYSSIGLNELNNPQNLYTLFAKLANIETDLAHGIQLDSSIVKKVISGEKVMAKPLYKQPIEYSPVAKILIGANSLPFLQSIDLSIKRRFVFIELKKTFYKNPDISLVDKLKAEKENIFVWAVKGLERLLERGIGFDVPVELEELVDQFIKDNDPVFGFLEDTNIIPGTDFKISYVDIHRQFMEYCKNNGLKAMPKNSFNKELRKKNFNDGREGGKRGFWISRKTQ